MSVSNVSGFSSCQQESRELTTDKLGPNRLIKGSFTIHGGAKRVDSLKDEILSNLHAKPPKLKYTF